MGAKLVVEKAEMELSGGAELEYGNWKIKVDEDFMIITCGGDMSYKMWKGSNGWISVTQDFLGPRTCTIYNLPEGKTNLLHRGLETSG